MQPRILMKRILIIEDDPRIAAALKVRLTARGYDILTAGNGFEGLKLAMNSRPDLLLLDIMMPMGMGFSVAERLKAVDLGHIPIIFITASKRTGLRRTAAKLGAAGFFEKPYDAEELISAIDLILGSSTAKAQPHAPSANPDPRSCA